MVGMLASLYSSGSALSKDNLKCPQFAVYAILLTTYIVTASLAETDERLAFGLVAEH
jgi:hypothetical protein